MLNQESEPRARMRLECEGLPQFKRPREQALPMKKKDLAQQLRLMDEPRRNKLEQRKQNQARQGLTLCKSWVTLPHPWDSCRSGVGKFIYPSNRVEANLINEFRVNY